MGLEFPEMQFFDSPFTPLRVGQDDDFKLCAGLAYGRAVASKASEISQIRLMECQYHAVASTAI